MRIFDLLIIACFLALFLYGACYSYSINDEHTGKMFDALLIVGMWWMLMVAFMPATPYVRFVRCTNDGRRLRREFRYPFEVVSSPSTGEVLASYTDGFGRVRGRACICITDKPLEAVTVIAAALHQSPQKADGGCTVDLDATLRLVGARVLS